MKTSGEILKEKRLEKGLTLETVEKNTKIRQKYLKAIEEGKIDNIPGKTYIRGFVKNYSEFLGLPTEEILAILRREYDEKKKRELIPKGLEKPLARSKIFGKKLTLPITFLIALIILFIYIFFQYQALVGKPSLEVTSPIENLITNDDSILIKGITDREGKILLNGQEIMVNDKGEFIQTINLKNGDNSIVIVAINKEGNEKKIERIVKKQNP